jgi:limonene-1,2-epoxide hydrolase
MEVLDSYVKALQENDWTALADTLSDAGVYRVGPFLDVVEGKDAYVAFLSGLLPTLQNYQLTVDRVSELPSGEAVVELRERLDVDGVSQEFPEAIFFGFDTHGRINRVRIYIQQPGADAPVEGGSAAP